MRRVVGLSGLVLLACMGRDNLVAEAPQESASIAAESKRAAPERCSVAASIPYWDQESAAAALRARVELIDTVSLFWFHLTPDGEIEPYVRAKIDRSLLRFAREHGVKTLALVANLPDDEREGDGLTWDPERVSKILRPAAARARHIRALVRLAGRFDGIHIDYEALPATDREGFTRFIAELGEALRSSGKILAVALHDKTGSRDPREDNGSWAQDWRALAEHADQLHLMTYNQHNAGTRPGPVASLRWVEPVLRHAVDLRLPADRVFVGLPLYGEEWHRDGHEPFSGLDEDRTYRQIHRQLRQRRGELRWSDKHASPRASFRESPDHEHVVWFEDARSSARKLELMRRLGLCNVALWRLGGEDPELWPVLRRWLDDHEGEDR